MKHTFTFIHELQWPLGEQETDINEETCCTDTYMSNLKLEFNY